MKKLKKFSLFLVLLFIIAIFPPKKAEARAFGQECETITTGGGTSCYVTRTICEHYFLWIKYDTTIENIQIDCSHLQQPE